MFRLLSTALLASVLLMPSKLVAGEVWKIASLNWEPYSSALMTTQGNSIQKLRLLLKRVDIELVVEFYPWRRAQQLAKEPGYVGYFPAWPEEVVEGFTASPAVDWSSIGVMKRPGFNSAGEDLGKMFRESKVGLISTYVYPESISREAARHASSVSYAPNEKSLLRMLSKGRYDYAITDPYVMGYLADFAGEYQVEVDRVLMKKALVLAIRNDEHTRDRLELLGRLLQQQGGDT